MAQTKLSVLPMNTDFDSKKKYEHSQIPHSPQATRPSVSSFGGGVFLDGGGRVKQIVYSEKARKQVREIAQGDKKVQH